MLYRTLLLVSFIALCCGTVHADSIVAEHGKYTQTYQSDWSNLDTGDVIAGRDPSQINFTTIVGDSNREVFTHSTSESLQNVHYKVTWNRDNDKYGTTLVRFTNVDEVVIENVSIMNLDPDYKSYHSILVEGAQSVIIRNVYLAGPVSNYHIRLEGCGDVLIENVEIAGVSFNNSTEYRQGGGIWINNGATGKGGVNNTGVFTEYACEPGWQIVQNCYIHDYSENDGTSRNQDGILIQSPSHGIVFNNVIENWFQSIGDAAMDMGFRRNETEYQNKCLRVERNIFRNTTMIKTPGKAPGPNIMYFANNQMINTQISDYHGSANNIYYTHNTFIYDINKAPANLTSLAERGAEGMTNLWDFSGPTYLTNNLIYRPTTNTANFRLIFMNDDASSEKYRQYIPNHNVYAIPANNSQYLYGEVGGLICDDFDDWQDETGFDMQSKQILPGVISFANYVNNDFQLNYNLWENIVETQNIGFKGILLNVTQDFDGNPRGLTPGAFEAQ